MTIAWKKGERVNLVWKDRDGNDSGRLPAWCQMQYRKRDPGNEAAKPTRWPNQKPPIMDFVEDRR